jgi:hypothetical protein
VTGVSSRRSPPQRGRRPLFRIVLWAAALGVAFALGLALGQATATDSEPTKAVTSTRVIVPVGATRETVTVTETVTEP